MVVTQLEHRYNALLTVSMRNVKESSPAWREVLQLSQHTGLRFSPDETLHLQHGALAELRSAWGLHGLGDECLVRLLLVLGGRQPVQMASLLRHLFKTLPCNPGCTGLHVSGVHVPAFNPNLPLQAPFCQPCQGRCLGARMLGGLPRLMCMTDTGFLEDIAWVVALSHNA